MNNIICIHIDLTHKNELLLCTAVLGHTVLIRVSQKLFCQYRQNVS